jgi:PTS system N-acetylglucosamine-specific IIA component
VALIVGAPLAGTAVPLADVPDPVFAGAIVGPGGAVEPDDDATIAMSPIAGTLVKVKPHAFVVADQSGRAVLVHLGIDTVKMGGDGFEVVAAEGATVGVGDQVIHWRPAAVRAAGLSAICPVIALDASGVSDVTSGRVVAGDALYTWAETESPTVPAVLSS